MAVFLTLQVVLRGFLAKQFCFEKGRRERCHGLVAVLGVCVASQRCKGRGKRGISKLLGREKTDQKAFSQNTSSKLCITYNATQLALCWKCLAKLCMHTQTVVIISL